MSQNGITPEESSLMKSACSVPLHNVTSSMAAMQVAAAASTVREELVADDAQPRESESQESGQVGDSAGLCIRQLSVLAFCIHCGMHPSWLTCECTVNHACICGCMLSNDGLPHDRRAHYFF